MFRMLISPSTLRSCEAAKSRWAVQKLTAPSAPIRCMIGNPPLARGRELARNKEAELIIKDESGKIVGRDSHGNDPRRIKG